MCVAPETVAVPAVVALSSLLGAHVRVEPEQSSAWRVVPNLWGCVVDRPGGLKTPAQQSGTAPIRAIAKRLREEDARRRGDSKIAREVITSKLNALKRRAEPDPDELRELYAKLESFDVQSRRIVVNDSTVEKLGELLIRSLRGLLVEHDELTSMFTTFSKQGHESDRSFYLAAWAGDAGHAVDRIGRGEIWIQDVCLSVIGNIQPGPLQKLVRDATQAGAGDDGLLQRFQLLVWPDSKPSFASRIRSTPSSWVTARYHSLFEDIDEATIEPIERPFRFAPDAQHRFDDWRAVLEARLEGDELRETPSFESHIAKYRSLVPSLAMVLHAADGDIGLPTISDLAVERAIGWVDFLEGHARKVYAPALYPGVFAAEGLARRLREGMWCDGESLTDLRRRSWRGLSTADEIGNGVRCLEDAGWARIVRVSPSSGRGRPSLIVRVHPSLRGEA